MKATLIALSAALSLMSSVVSSTALANAPMTSALVPEVSVPADAVTDDADSTALDELDPFDPAVEQTLQMTDWLYEATTGQSAHLPMDNVSELSGCYRQTCQVWVRVSKSRQNLELYQNGNLTHTWAVSTGTPGRDTPNFDQHPDGRIYDRYTSTRYPGGDYNGLGNMPYAVFIRGGFALHGTGRGNWSRLGRRASHGCIRQHPDNALYFNRLVRQVGGRNVWITVEN